MDEDFTSLIEESINLELNVANLYTLFYNFFPGDESFWWKLVVEEKNHAALFRSGQDIFKQSKKFSKVIFPKALLVKNLKELQNINTKINNLLKKFKSNPPSREEAFNTAYSLENSAAELHFQNFMDKEANSKLDTIFKQLNNDDKDHAMRIRVYMKSQDIPLQSENENRPIVN